MRLPLYPHGPNAHRCSKQFERLKVRGRKLNLSGKRYDTFQVIGNGSKPRYWKCKCNGGHIFEAIGSRLNAGKIKCKCQRTIKHGNARRGNHSPEYRCWQYMKRRCKSDPNYAEVEYDRRWEDFANFYADMGPRPEGYSLDRKNPFGGYSRENCRWAPPDVQASNKRGARLLRYDWAFDGATGKRYGGAVATVAEWAWYLRRMTGRGCWTTQKLLQTLKAFTLDQILKTASPWGLPPEELSWMARPDFSYTWEDYQRDAYLQAA